MVVNKIFGLPLLFGQRPLSASVLKEETESGEGSRIPFSCSLLKALFENSQPSVFYLDLFRVRPIYLSYIRIIYCFA